MRSCLLLCSLLSGSRTAPSQDHYSHGTPDLHIPTCPFLVISRGPAQHLCSLTPPPPVSGVIASALQKPPGLLTTVLPANVRLVRVCRKDLGLPTRGFFIYSSEEGFAFSFLMRQSRADSHNNATPGCSQLAHHLSLTYPLCSVMQTSAPPPCLPGLFLQSQYPSIAALQPWELSRHSSTIPMRSINLKKVNKML